MRDGLWEWKGLWGTWGGLWALLGLGVGYGGQWGHGEGYGDLGNGDEGGLWGMGMRTWGRVMGT